MRELRILRPGRRPFWVAANLPDARAAQLAAARENRRRGDGIVFPVSMGELRAAGIDPRGQPIRTYVRGRIGQMPYQKQRRCVIEVIEVLSVVRILAAFRVSVRQ